MSKQNVREVALELLIQIEKSGGFSHLLISNAINKAKINEKDEGLLTEIVYGTTEYKLTLDYYLQPYIEKQKKLADWVIMLLRMSAYQMHYLEKVPSYAVINEAVNIAKKKGHKGIASLVNGVLRNMLRNGVRELDEITDKQKRLSIETSHPAWLVARWVELYGYETTEEICRTNTRKKELSVRVNPLKATREEVLVQLETAGITAVASSVTRRGILISNGNIFRTDLWKEGYISVQDESSMLAAEYLQVEAGMNVLDTCSAPGGKSCFIAEEMNNTGTVHAYDLHDNKLKLITESATRLGLSNIKVASQDARNLPHVLTDKFPRILIDAPCSGLGVIRSKPDIKYSKQREDSERLHGIQLAILQSVSELLAEDGKLIYSTCTIEQQENEDVVEQFLNENQDFKVDSTFIEEVTRRFGEIAKVTVYGLQLFPQSINSDGFFITRLEKQAK